MARVLRTPYPCPDYESYVNRPFETYERACEDFLDSIPEDKLFDYPVHDGRAYYYIVSLEPLVLQSIPLWDAYELNPIFMRGLRKADVLLIQANNKALDAIFNKDK
jgi:hypothetical protein